MKTLLRGHIQNFHSVKVQTVISKEEEIKSQHYINIKGGGVNNKANIICQHCDKTCNTENELKSHMEKTHEDIDSSFFSVDSSEDVNESDFYDIDF